MRKIRRIRASKLDHIFMYFFHFFRCLTVTNDYNKKYLKRSSKFSLNSTNLGIFPNIPNYKDFYSKHYSKKTTKFLEKFLEWPNSKNKNVSEYGPSIHNYTTEPHLSSPILTSPLHHPNLSQVLPTFEQTIAHIPSLIWTPALSKLILSLISFR